MKLPLINSKDADLAKEILGKVYSSKLIPAEKKTYLTKLRESVGPYLGVESENGETHYILDAASQIATLGHGFNPSIFFGTSQFLESWLNDPTTKEIKEMRSTYVNFFNRKLGWKKTYMTLTHSGAEANETALGYCYLNRVNPNANKVLAFEGSFHGRMMITLAATWNKSKREPFEWKNYLAQYVDYPELQDSNINVAMPENWREKWNDAALKNFAIPTEWQEDASLASEIKSLLSVRERLLTKEIFAILIEPMQCEGGDRYSSDRFNTALLLMARTFSVPVIFDEVQTGFHLGREFFWHRQLNLKGLNGEQINPDYVVCAKKAQLGIVLSHRETKNIFKGEEFSVASLLRGYAHAISLDQSQERIIKLEEETRPRLEKLIKKHEKFIGRPRINGLAFGFDVPDTATLNKFVELRFKHGLMYYPAGDKTLRFRLSCAFRPKDLDYLFHALDLICRELFLNEPQTPATHFETDVHEADENYQWHNLLIETKLAKSLGQRVDLKKVFDSVNILVNKHTTSAKVELFEINANNFINYREAIIKIQTRVYEPARQTDIEKFEHTVLDKNSICLGLLDEKKNLVGIAFAGPLNLYPLERGVRMDPHYNDQDSLYMLDVTIDPSLQSAGLGKSLKYALSTIAIVKGAKRIQGRNRDRLASSMLNINLSLGSVEQSYIKEDYPDFESHRDVFYYTTKVDWKKTNIHLSRATTIPFSMASLTKNYIDAQMPRIVNKITLSNFVSADFIEGIRYFSTFLPEDLRHVYTTSGQSECVDKVIKSIWFKSNQEIKDNNTTKMLTFKGHYFGQGSALARSLSLDNDPYFNVQKIQNPTERNYQEVLNEVESEFKTKEYLAVWIEPLMQKTMEKMPYEFLRGLKKLAQDYNVALIYNETASQFYRYSLKEFMASNFAEITPDAGFVYCSGQSGIVYTSSRYFLEQPLMLISTWDGDEFNFLSYIHALKEMATHLEQYKKTIHAFHEKLLDNLTRYEIDQIKIENGFGYFKGSIPNSMSKMFIGNKGHYIVCPSFDAMKEYVEL